MDSTIDHSIILITGGTFRGFQGRFVESQVMGLFELRKTCGKEVVGYS